MRSFPAGRVETGRVDDAWTRSLPAGPALEVDGDGSPSIGWRPPRSSGGRLTGRLALETASGPRLGQQFERDLVGGHAQRDRSTGLAQVPVERAAGAHDDGEPARPELATSARTSSATTAASASRVGMPGISTGGGAARSRPLASSSRATAAGEGVGRHAVDGVGGDDDEFAAPMA